MPSVAMASQGSDKYGGTLSCRMKFLSYWLAGSELLTQGCAAAQASTNTLLSHFVSLLSSLWILLQISQKPPVSPESLGAVPARA